MQFHDIDQNTDEWLDMRIAKLTGSGCSKIMASRNDYVVLLIEKDNYAIANTKTKKLLKKRYKGNFEAHNALIEMQKKDISMSFGEPAKQLATAIAIEQLTGKRSGADNYSNEHMERGHEQEPIARALYENKYFVDVSNGGFFDCGNTGCSPDGLVLADGLIEIKSVIAHVHYANIKRGGIDPAYKWQINFNLLKTEKNWIDSISYCADFPEDKRLYVHRLTREDCAENFKMIEEREKQFFELVEDIKYNITNG